MEQPAVEILSAALIKANDEYVIIGELQNVDRIPADVVVKGSLYDEKDQKLASYNAKYQMKHRLMPQETTVFKIEFEGIAWANESNLKPDIFNPKEFTPVSIIPKAVSFDLHCAANIVTRDLYKSLSIQHVQVANNTVDGILFNSGTREITVPQMLLSYYDADANLTWVENKFLTEGIRVQHKHLFEIELANPLKLETISTSLDKCYVNGMKNGYRNKFLIPERIIGHSEEHLMPIKHSHFKYLKIDSNAFIGNPK